jgi:hypothetical protein
MQIRTCLKFVPRPPERGPNMSMNGIVINGEIYVRRPRPETFAESKIWFQNLKAKHDALRDLRLSNSVSLSSCAR